MRSWVRNTLIGIGALCAFAGFSYYWLFLESHVPRSARFELDLAEIRRLADDVAGEKPSKIEVEEVAQYSAPATVVVAGDGWSTLKLPVYSYRVVFPTGSSIIIDTALTEELASEGGATFDAQAFSRMHAAMAEAGAIVLTHEHVDHIGGLTAHRDLSAILHNVSVTREQLSDPERSAPARFPPGALDQYEPLAYERLHALAPGIVLIKAPGHSPGSQMVFVQLADGSEYLFIGDVAWNARNIELRRERARIVTWLLLKEDRHAVFGQLAALYELQQREPGIKIVPGHDGGIIDELVKSGALTRGFSLESVPVEEDAEEEDEPDPEP
ncbi:MAG TPA: MBL fold metallo-hydrolase [Steroidobacteraceae bacterium]